MEMDIFSIWNMMGGLALFLYGMHLLGNGLSQAAGGRMESILSKMTDHPLKAVLLGAGATAAIQSSSATTVMVVSFVNAGVMQLQHYRHLLDFKPFWDRKQQLLPKDAKTRGLLPPPGNGRGYLPDILQVRKKEGRWWDFIRLCHPDARHG